MTIKQIFGNERVYTSIGLLAAAFVLVFMSYFVLPSDALHAGLRIGETIYLTIIFAVLVIIFYNIYYTLAKKDKKPNQEKDAGDKKQEKKLVEDPEMEKDQAKEENPSKEDSPVEDDPDKTVEVDVADDAGVDKKGL